MTENSALEEADSEESAVDVWARETAPQTPYTLRQVGIGLVVFVIGAAIVIGVPLVLA